MSEPRRWTICGGAWVSEQSYVPPSVHPALGPAESVEVIEAAPVEAEIADLRARVCALEASEDDLSGYMGILKAHVAKFETVLRNIRVAYDKGWIDIPEVNAAIEAQVREALEPSVGIGNEKSLERRSVELERLRRIEQAARDALSHTLADDHRYQGRCPCEGDSCLDSECAACVAIAALREALNDKAAA